MGVEVLRIRRKTYTPTIIDEGTEFLLLRCIRIVEIHADVVEVRGFEPLTSAVRLLRSPN